MPRAPRLFQRMRKYLTVATVLKPQGIRGEIKLKVYLDNGADILAVKRVAIGGREYEVMGGRAQGEFAFVSLKGVADRNAAEELRGKEVVADRAELPALPENRYYIADLIGCEVVTDSGESVGKVEAVTPAKTDVYTLRADGKEIVFAAAAGVILSVEPEEGRIVVDGRRFKEVSL